MDIMYKKLIFVINTLIMITKNDILKFLRSNKKFFKQKYNINKIGIFGSIARDEQNENSDIDIILEFDEATTDLFGKKLELKDFFKTKFNCEVDICREGAIKPVFKNLILKDAIFV